MSTSLLNCSTSSLHSLELNLKPHTQRILYPTIIWKHPPLTFNNSHPMRLTFPPGYLEMWPCWCGLSERSNRVPLPFSIAPVASLLHLPRCPASFLSPSPGPPVSPEASSPPLEVTQILMRSGVCFRTQKLCYYILVLTSANLRCHCTKIYRNMKKTPSSNTKESTVVWWRMRLKSTL